MQALKTFALFLTIVSTAYCARILCVFNVASISHQQVFQPIWRELSLRGHNVTVITTDPLNDPTLVNLTEIDVGPPLYERIRKLGSKFSKKINHWILGPAAMFSAVGGIRVLFEDPEVLALVKDESKEFDVVLSEYTTTGGSMFAARFKCPLIGVASLPLMSVLYDTIGTPTHPILYPDILMPYVDEDPGFFTRVETVANAIFWRLFYRYVVIPAYDKAMREHLGDDLPYYADVERNASIILVNSNPIFHGSRPLGPNVIEIGRMHIKPNQKLPKDLQEYLDEATEGAIYFSLGSNVRSIFVDEHKRRTIIKTFSELPYKVLWKFENDNITELPGNVLMRPWFPQQAILAHPNVKLFVTQGGLQSTEEGIVNKVPMLAIPFIFDQYYNSKRIETLGIGLNIHLEDLSTEIFKNSIIEVIRNPRYKQTISEVAETIADEPSTGLERAVFWVEYVIRHKGAKYLTSRARDVSWYKYLMIDVFSFFMILSCLTVFSFYKVVKLLLLGCRRYNMKLKVT